MRVLSQAELARCTKGELHALLRVIASELPHLAEKSQELRVAHFTCRISAGRSRGRISGRAKPSDGELWSVPRLDLAGDRFAGVPDHEILELIQSSYHVGSPEAGDHFAGVLAAHVAGLLNGHVPDLSAEPVEYLHSVGRVCDAGITCIGTVIGDISCAVSQVGLEPGPKILCTDYAPFRRPGGLMGHCSTFALASRPDWRSRCRSEGDGEQAAAELRQRRSGPACR
jgi:hypothetical protein